MPVTLRVLKFISDISNTFLSMKYEPPMVSGLLFATKHPQIGGEGYCMCEEASRVFKLGEVKQINTPIGSCTNDVAEI